MRDPNDTATDGQYYAQEDSIGLESVPKHVTQTGKITTSITSSLPSEKASAAQDNDSREEILPRQACGITKTVHVRIS